MAMMTEAFSKIRGIASSYLSHPLMLRAKSIASAVARDTNINTGAAIGGMVGSAIAMPAFFHDYKQGRSQGRGRVSSYARATVKGYPTSFGAMGLGAAAGFGYGAMLNAGGFRSVMQKANVYGSAAKAFRYGASTLDKIIGKIR